MEMHILEIGKKIKHMVKENIYMLIKVTMMVIGIMINNMDTVKKNIQMGLCIKDNIIWVKNMEKEYLHG